MPSLTDRTHRHRHCSGWDRSPVGGRRRPVPISPGRGCRHRCRWRNDGDDNRRRPGWVRGCQPPVQSWRGNRRYRWFRRCRHRRGDRCQRLRRVRGQRGSGRWRRQGCPLPWLPPPVPHVPSPDASSSTTTVVAIDGAGEEGGVAGGSAATVVGDGVASSPASVGSTVGVGGTITGEGGVVVVVINIVVIIVIVVSSWICFGEGVVGSSVVGRSWRDWG